MYGMKENGEKSTAWLPWVPEVFSRLVHATWGLAHEKPLGLAPGLAPSVVTLLVLTCAILGLISGIVFVMKFKMAAAAVKFVWLETIRNARKTSLVQDGKK